MNHKRALRLWASAAIGAALLVVGPVLAGDSAYCKICKDHTLCRYQGVSASCQGRMLGRGLRPGEADFILDLHNKMRSKVASGREFEGNQPPAADMRKLVWDSRLARIAQRWADQCKYDHDSCKDLAGVQVGQNLFAVYGKVESAVADWNGTIYSWYNEVSKFDKSNVKELRTLGESSHYSQMMTAASRMMGCGYTAYRDSTQRQPVTHMYVCNYGPSGNRRGRPVYTIGRPCTRCPPGHKCSEAVGLCESQFTARSLHLVRR